MSGREGSAQALLWIGQGCYRPLPPSRRGCPLTPPSTISPSHTTTLNGSLLMRKKVEKALKMSFLPCTLRWTIMLHSHNVNFVSILHFLISFYLSCIDIKIEENLQSMVIQPEDNLDPAVGPVLRLYMNYDPSLSGKGKVFKTCVWFL